MSDIVDSGRKIQGRMRDKLIGVYIGILAVSLAVCTLGGGNATKIATLKTIEASNAWSFFQAKNVRRQIIRVAVGDLELLLQREAQMPEVAKSAIEAKLMAYREMEKTLTSEPAKGEGLDELFAKGKALEAERDQAMRQDPYFDYGQALLQIAIVLASVAILAGGNFLLWISGALGALGALMTLNGFLLLFSAPFIG